MLGERQATDALQRIGDEIHPAARPGLLHPRDDQQISAVEPIKDEGRLEIERKRTERQQRNGKNDEGPVRHAGSIARAAASLLVQWTQPRDALTDGSSRCPGGRSLHASAIVATAKTASARACRTLQPCGFLFLASGTTALGKLSRAMRTKMLPTEQVSCSREASTRRPKTPMSVPQVGYAVRGSIARTVLWIRRPIARCSSGTPVRFVRATKTTSAPRRQIEMRSGRASGGSSRSAPRTATAAKPRAAARRSAVKMATCVPIRADRRMAAIL